MNHFFFFPKDPSRWERYPYDPRYRDPRSYDQRYWYDAEHSPYQKREAYPYGSRFVQSIHVLPVLFPELGQQILGSRLLKCSVTHISQCSCVCVCMLLVLSVALTQVIEGNQMSCHIILREGLKVAALVFRPVEHSVGF